MKVPATTGRNGLKFRCKVTNANGSATTSTAVLTVTSAVTPAPTPAPTSYTYVLNTNTLKFHRPSCSSVSSMSESHKWYCDGTRDEVIAMGYDACKRCNP